MKDFSNTRQKVAFYEKGIFKKFARFTEKHFRLSFFFSKVASFRPDACNLIKKISRFRHKSFPANLAKFLRTPFIKCLRATAPHKRGTSNICFTAN